MTATAVAERPVDTWYREQEQAELTLPRHEFDPDDARDVAALSPAHLAEYASGGRWQPYDHHVLLNEYLVRVAQGQVRRLIITMPPQHGKSELTSHYFPAWYLGLNPDHRIVLASYAAEFASSWGRKVRDVIEEHGPDIYGFGVSPASHASHRWDLTRPNTGGMITVGRGGSVTGRPAHTFLIDDPLATSEEAENDALRDKLYNWYRTVARTRLRPDNRIIIIQTRWHEDDLAGRLLARQARGESGEYWHHLDLPGIAEGIEAGDTDALGRINGEALWPEAYDEEFLQVQAKELGPYYWAALYQQTPIPLGGTTFKSTWFRYYRVQNIEGQVFIHLLNPLGGVHGERVAFRACTVLTTVDLATGADPNKGSYTTIQTWLVTPKKQMILWDQVRFREEGPEQLEAIRAVYQKHRPHYIGVERVAYQLTAVQNLRRSGLPIMEMLPNGSKIGRALTPAARASGGDVYLPADSPGFDLRAWLDEVLKFPRAKTDDQVDCFSYAAEYVARGDWGEAAGVPQGIARGSESFLSQSGLVR